MIKFALILIVVLSGCQSRDWHSYHMRGTTDPVPTEESRTEVVVDWTVENLDKFDGASLTGRSFGSLDRDFNPQRIKIGVTSLGSRHIHNRNEEEIYRFIYNQDRHKTLRSTIIGIGFRKEF